MTIEEKLQALILARYHSIREFTITIDMPYTTMHSIFKRGIGNSSVTNVIKICKALGISADALADGKIVPVAKRNYAPVNVAELIEVKEIISDTKDRLIHSGELTLDGKPISRDSVESIIDAMEVGVEMAKKRSEV